VEAECRHKLLYCRKSFTYIWLYLGLLSAVFEILLPFSLLVYCNTRVFR
jgi:hypothetical protein